MADKVIGIDLGTTNSVVAATMEGGIPSHPPSDGGSTTRRGRITSMSIASADAKRQAVTNPKIPSPIMSFHGPAKMPNVTGS